MLSESERRRLAEIESALRAEDPGFAQRFSARPRRLVARRAVMVLTLVAAVVFTFQALFMKDMMGGTYLRALHRSFVPEWLSMNMMMAGMAPS